MGKKNRKKHFKQKTSKVTENLDTKTSVKSKKKEVKSQELEFKSNFIFYFYMFSAFLALMLFITYFLRSIDSFSYLISFYLIGNTLTYFFYFSSGFVIICLLCGLFYMDLFQKYYTPYIAIFGIVLAFIVSTLSIYPISLGYVPTINDPLIAVMLLLIDLVVEATPIIIGYITFKNIKSISQ